jgi:uncharacterized protein
MRTDKNLDSATVTRRVVIKKTMQRYLDLVRLGKNDWWRYVLAVPIILGMWQILGALPSVAILIWDRLGNGNQVGIEISGYPYTAAGFVALMLPSLFLISAIYLTVKFIHQRPFQTLITSGQSIAWTRLFQGFGLWFVLAALTSLVEALLFPGRYIWSLHMQRFLPFVFLAIVLVPIQTSAEELLFRAYFLQGAGLGLRNIWILCSISGLFFGLPHLLNPEASVNYPLLGFFYFAFGFFLAFITLRDGRLELALGAHAANNLFSVFFVNYKNSVLPSPSIFTVTVLDAVYSVSAGLLGMVIFILLVTGPLRRKDNAAD